MPASFIVDQNATPDNVTTFATIAAAVAAATGPTTITVSAGTYAENVLINKAGITLVSAAGAAATTIVGSAGSGLLGTIQVSPPATNVTIDGFTVEGYDGTSPGIETAAVYLQGNVSNITIVNNELVANGDAALQNEFSATVSNVTVDNNVISGQTFVGPTPGVGNQFVVPNVARQLVVFGGNDQNTSNIIFTNNQITGTAGAAGGAGNTLVTIDAANSTITGNTFSGFTSSGSQLRVREEGTTITGNSFGNTSGGNVGLFTQFAGGEIPGPMANTYDYSGAQSIIVAVAGNDVIDGGPGAQTLSMVNAGTAGSLVDLQSGVAFSTTTGIDDISNIENVSGSAGADGLYGDAGDNMFYATTGVDVVDGRGGVDTFVAGNTGNAVTANLATGVVSGAFTTTLTNVENITTGNGNDVVTDSSGANVISTGLGEDRIILSGGGSDSVYGGMDSDTVVFTGARADYTITWDGTTATVTQGAASVTIASAGRLEFSDKDVLLVNNTSDEFSTIQSAVNAAANGDEILVAAGTYLEQVVISGKADLLIKSTGAVTIEAPADVTQTVVSSTGRALNGVVTVIGSTNIQLVGFTVDGAGAGNSVDGSNANFVGVVYRNASGGLTDVNVTGIHDAYPGGTTADGFPIQSGSQRGVGIQVDNDSLMSFVMQGGTIDDFQKNATVFNRAILDVSGVSIIGGGAQTINAQNGFQVLNSQGTLSDNIITAIGYAGTQVVYSGAMLVYGNTNLHITDNTIVGTNITTPDGKVVGIYVLDFGTPNSGGSITGNIISFVDGGIDVSGGLGPNGILIENNTITDLDLNDDYVSGVYFSPNAAATPYDVDGSAGADFLQGGSGADTFAGLDGDDEINGAAGNDDLSGGAGNDVITGGNGDDTITGGDGADNLAGGAGNDLIVADAFDTVYGGANTDVVVLATGADPAAVVAAAANFSGVEIITTGEPSGPRTFVVLDGMSIQAAIDAAADGDTILVAPGAYTTSANYNPTNNTNDPGFTNPVGLLINKSVTIAGVDATGALITDSGDVAATVTASVESNWGTSFFVTAAGVTITGLNFVGASPGGVSNKVFEIIEDDFTLAHSIVGSAGGDIGATIYVNDDVASASNSFVSDIDSFNIHDNVLKGDFVLANGAGFGHAITDLRLENNEFVLNLGASLDWNWGVIITGKDDAVAWRVQSVGPLVATGNSFAADYTTDRLLFVRDDDASRLPSAAFVEAFIASNGITRFAYAVDTMGVPSVVNTGSTFAYVLALSAGNASGWANPGDTLIVQSDGSAATEVIVTDALNVDLRSSGLTLEMQGGVASMTVLGSEAVDIVGNAGDNVINATDGVNTITGLAGADTIDAKDGNDVVTGGDGIDNLQGGDGDDTFVYNDESELDGGELVDGGAGTDAVVYADADGGTLILTANVTGIEVVNLSTAGGLDAVAMNLDASAMVNALTINGNGAANSITGTTFADTINGGGGADSIVGGGGDDSIAGGDGMDVVTFVGARGSYAITWDGTTATVSDGTDTLTLSNVGRLDFAGSSVFLVDDSSGEFATIQSAVAAASGGDEILLGAGIYSGDVNVDKALTITGPNAGVAGNGPRGAEATLNGTITLSADGITLDGFAIDGEAVRGSAVRGGAGGMALDDITVNNMVMTGQTGQALLAGFGFGGGIGSENWVVTGNLVTNIQGNNATGIVLFNITGLDLSGNVVDHDLVSFSGRRGINLDGIVDGLIVGNRVLQGDVTNTSWGIQISMSDREVSNLDVMGNIVSGTALGISVLSQRSISDVVISGNNVTATNGIILNGGSGAPVVALPIFSGVQVTNNNIQATTYAVFVRDLHGNHANGPITYADLIVTNNFVVSGIIQLGRTETFGAGGLLLNVTGAVEVDGSSFADAVMIEGTGTVDFTGGGGNDTGIGSVGADTMTGDAGNDDLTGGGGDDDLYGGANDDTFGVTAAADLTAGDLIDGGSGTDTVIFRSAAGGTLTLTTGIAGVEVASLSTDGALDAVAMNLDASAMVNALTINGNGAANSITGTTFADTINGGGGADSIVGGGGNDSIDGGAGMDVVTFVGDRDDYTVTWDGTTATVSDGTDTLTITSAGRLQFTDKAVLLVDDTSAEYATIQSAVDAASNGDEILVSAGSYAGATITDKAVAIIGSEAGVNVVGSFAVSDDMAAGEELRFANLVIDATGQVQGIYIRSSSADILGVNGGSIVLDGVSISNAREHGLFYAQQSNGSNPVNGNTVGSFTILNSVFTANGQTYTGQRGQGHVNLFGFNGNLTVMDSVFTASATDLGDAIFRGGTVGTNGAVANADKAITVTGIRTGTPGVGGYVDAGTLVMSGVDVTGFYSSDVISFYTIQSFVSVTMADVVVTARAPWALINFDSVSGPIDLSTGFTGTNTLPVEVAELQGLSTADALTGTSGKDLLYGRGGADTLVGGDGDDLFVYTSSAEFAAGESVAGGNGTDTVYFGTAASDTLVLSAAVTGIETVVLNTAGAGNLIAMNVNASAVGNGLSMFGNGAANRLIGTAFADVVFGGGGNDSLSAGALNDMLFGGAGDDTLVGGGGSDVLEGGAGADILNGSGGSDTASYAASAVGVSVDLEQSTAANGDATDDVSSSIENLIGSAQADTLTGDSTNNVITGNGGADVLDGAGGTDTVVFAADWDDYTITRSGSTYTVTQGLVSVSASNFETFVFDGVSYDVTTVPDSIVTDALPVIDSVLEIGTDEDANSATFALSEGAANGEMVLRVTGSDPNTLLGDVVTFSLVDGLGNAYAGPFAIMADGTGAAKVVLQGALNYEAVASYGFVIRATDVRGNFADQSVTVAVLDVNEAPGDGAGLATWTPVVQAGVTRGVLTPPPVVVDPEGDALTYTLASGATGGTFYLGDTLVTVGTTLTAAEFASLAYEAPGAPGVYSGAVFTVSDGVNDVPLTVVINVTPGTEDLLTGDANANLLDGGNGKDTLSGLDGDDTLYAGSGDDLLRGGAGSDAMYGGGGADVMTGAAGADSLYGGAGIDTVKYEQATIGLVVSLANAALNTESAAGDIFGSIENLIGGLGADTLSGNGQSNAITGGAGNDVLNGGLGRDRLTGGADSDTFVFATTAVGADDAVTDFVSGVDKIGLSAAAYTAFGATLDADEFRIAGTGPSDANDYLFYRQTNGFLYYDADGSGAGAAVLIARLGLATPLVFADLTLV